MSLLDRPAHDTEPAPGPLRRNRDFLLLWTGAGLSLLGLRASTAAYPLLMLWYGGSPAGAGLVGAAALLPQLLVQLPAGALVDRWDRRRLLIGCDAAGLVAMGNRATHRPQAGPAPPGTTVVATRRRGGKGVRPQHRTRPRLTGRGPVREAPPHTPRRDGEQPARRGPAVPARRNRANRRPQAGSAGAFSRPGRRPGGPGCVGPGPGPSCSGP
ncbi:MFS transporter [Streptomyces sp. NPDC049577]|uniref:MFS transporter n=1 Tax=Streptomyces sp. NPDC049577 TaxID=3155153 RepID=UPI003413A647